MAGTQVILFFTPVLQEEGFPSHFVCCKIMELQGKVGVVIGIQVVIEGSGKEKSCL